MKMERLRCTHCYDDFDVHNVFEPIKEFQKCPKCKIGFLVDGHFAETGKSALTDLSNLDPPDDFFDSGYEDEKSGFHCLNPNDIVPEHPNCSCHSENDDKKICKRDVCDYTCGNVHLDLPEWNMLLSTNDIEQQQFIVCTLDYEDEKIPQGALNKMDKIFYNTFRPRELS